MLDKIAARLNENLARVSNLVAIYETIRGQGRGRRGAKKTDVLRAAVILLHATLEDLLRSLAEWKLPSMAAGDVLDSIPFAGTGSRPQKVFLGYLANHRGMTVDELIALSISEYLEKSNYNDTTEVAGLLSAIGIDVDSVNGHFAVLTELMERRHLIVHRADRDETGGRGRFRVQSLGPKKVRTWIDAVRQFSEDVMQCL